MDSSIAETLAAVNPWAGQRNTNMSAQGFILGLPLLHDVGYVTNHVYVPIFLWNGLEYSVAISAVSGDDGAEGIFWDLVAPMVLKAMQSVKVVIDVTVDGPLVFTGLISFVTVDGTIVLTITGTRAPHLSGDVGYLMFTHNWENGLDETLEWKTDVLVAFDKTEQRIKLRSLPRRSWDCKFLISGDKRRKLETWMGMRKVRYFCLPVFRDSILLLSNIVTGSSIIVIAAPTDNTVVGGYVAVWTTWDNMEIRKITGVGQDYLAVDTPFLSDWNAGEAQLAPVRYCFSLEQRRVSRFTEDVGDYSMTLVADVALDKWNPDPLNSIVLDTWQSTLVCPAAASWDGGEEGYDNKWVRLDNETGVLEFDIQSEEPVLTRDLHFVLIGRDKIDLFLVFLEELAGRLTPFFVSSNDRGFELSAEAASGSNFIVISSIDYEYSLKDSAFRSYIEMIKTDGTVIRRKITGVETLENGDEKLILNEALTTALTAQSLNRCAWLEKVRLDSDAITLHWIGGDCLEITMPVVVL